MFLKGHANEGIIAGQFDLDGAHAIEFNVAWHHGESGGPVAAAEPFGVIAMMQQYRGIQTPHGVVAGPHLGRALSNAEAKLRAFGVKVV